MAATDTYNAYYAPPPSGAEAITPNDSTDLTYVTTRLYVGTTGDVKVTMQSGDIVTFTNLAGGYAHEMRVTRVWATLTTALGLIGLR